MSYPIVNHEDNIDKVRKGRPPTVAMRKDGPLRRWNIYWPKSTLDMIDNIAVERDVTRKEVLMQALSLFQAAHEAAKSGKPVGVARCAEDLETALVLPFLG